MEGSCHKYYFTFSSPVLSSALPSSYSSSSLFYRTMSFHSCLWDRKNYCSRNFLTVLQTRTELLPPEPEWFPLPGVRSMDLPSTGLKSTFVLLLFPSQKKLQVRRLDSLRFGHGRLWVNQVQTGTTDLVYNLRDIPHVWIIDLCLLGFQGSQEINLTLYKWTYTRPPSILVVLGNMTLEDIRVQKVFLQCEPFIKIIKVVNCVSNVVCFIRYPRGGWG